MPTVAELDRLQALVERLTPLAGVKPGEPLEAAEWNAVVGALIELARAVLGGDRSETVPPHDHTDQVKSSWLDPALRTLIERGGLSDPSSARELIKVDATLKKLDARVRTLDGSLGDVRGRISEVSTRDVVRETAVTKLARGLENVQLAPDEVRSLRRSFDSVAADVRTAIAAAEKLTVGGEPADLDSIDSRIASLEQMRDGLIGPEGALFNAAALERRLTELTNTLVTEEELDEVLKSRPVVVPEDRVAELSSTLQVALRNSVMDDMTALETRLRSESNARFSDVEALVARRVSDATPALRDQILQQVRNEMQAADAALRTGILAEVDKARSAAIAASEQRTDGRIETLQTGIATTVRTELDRLLPSRLAALDARVTAATASMDESVARLDTLDKALAATNQQLADQTRSIRQEIANTRDTLRQETNALSKMVAADQAALEKRVLETTNARIDASAEKVTTTLRAEIKQSSTTTRSTTTTTSPTTTTTRLIR